MIRDYSVGNTGQAILFSGIEIEKTMFYGLKTLFVVGVQPLSDLLKFSTEEQCSHIYLGANHSATEDNVHNLIYQAKILIEGYQKKVTLDIDVSLYELCHTVLLDDSSFCLIVSCKLPNIERIKNVWVKVDDVDFRYSNSGVWLHEAVNSSVVTSWDEYSKDKILKEG